MGSEEKKKTQQADGQVSEEKKENSAKGMVLRENYVNLNKADVHGSEGKNGKTSAGAEYMT